MLNAFNKIVLLTTLPPPPLLCGYEKIGENISYDEKLRSALTRLLLKTVK